MPFFLYSVGGGSPQSDCICRAKPKNRIFANGQFSGHLIFYKKKFSRRKKNFYSYKRELYFFEKKYFSFFWKIFFENFFFKISKSFLPIKNLWMFFLNFFEKKFSKKTFFFKKKKNVFFQKNKVLIYKGPFQYDVMSISTILLPPPT